MPSSAACWPAPLPPLALNALRWSTGAADPAAAGLARVLATTARRREIAGPLAAAGPARRARRRRLQRAAVPGAADLDADQRDADRRQHAGVDAARRHRLLPRASAAGAVARRGAVAARRADRAAARRARAGCAACSSWPVTCGCCWPRCRWALYSWLLARPPPALARASAGRLGLGRVPARAGAVRPALGRRRGRRSRPPPADAHDRGRGRRPAGAAAGPALHRRRPLGARLPLLGPGRGRRRPGLAAFFGNLTPLFAALLSALLLGEPPRLYHGLAFA